MKRGHVPLLICRWDSSEVSSRGFSFRLGSPLVGFSWLAFFSQPGSQAKKTDDFFSKEVWKKILLGKYAIGNLTQRYFPKENYITGTIGKLDIHLRCIHTCIGFLKIIWKSWVMLPRFPPDRILKFDVDFCPLRFWGPTIPSLSVLLFRGEVASLVDRKKLGSRNPN